MRAQPPSTSDLLAGVMLIIASVAALLSVLHHPHAEGHGTDWLANLQRIDSLSRAVHGAMIATIILIWLSLTQYCVSRARALVRSAWLCFGLGALAMIGAALLNGFVLSALASKAGTSAAEQAEFVRLVPLSWAMNQTLSAFGLLMSSVGMALWALDQWRAGVELAGSLGLLAAGSILLAWLTGALRMDVTGMIALVLASSVWYGATGLIMIRGNTLKDAGQ